MSSEGYLFVGESFQLRMLVCDLSFLLLGVGCPVFDVLGVSSILYFI